MDAFLSCHGRCRHWAVWPARQPLCHSSLSQNREMHVSETDLQNRWLEPNLGSFQNVLWKIFDLKFIRCFCNKCIFVSFGSGLRKLFTPEIGWNISAIPTICCVYFDLLWTIWESTIQINPFTNNKLDPLLPMTHFRNDNHCFGLWFAYFVVSHLKLL